MREKRGNSRGAGKVSPSAEPVRTRVPMAGCPMAFGDEEAKIGDTNGAGRSEPARFPFETNAER